MRTVGDAQDFRTVMAKLKRDNGILACHKDMLEVARENLGEAAEVRKTDPAALYYYAKVLKLLGRRDADQKKAIQLFNRRDQRR